MFEPGSTSTDGQSPVLADLHDQGSAEAPRWTALADSGLEFEHFASLNFATLTLGFGWYNMPNPLASLPAMLLLLKIASCEEVGVSGRAGGVVEVPEPVVLGYEAVPLITDEDHDGVLDGFTSPALTACAAVDGAEAKHQRGKTLSSGT